MQFKYKVILFLYIWNDHLYNYDQYFIQYEQHTSELEYAVYQNRNALDQDTFPLAPIYGTCSPNTSLSKYFLLRNLSSYSSQNYTSLKLTDAPLGDFETY